MNNPTVSVIVVNWNGGDLLLDCLQGLACQSLQPRQIFLIDNGSSDGSAERAEQLSGITVIKAGANLGFAAGNNRALPLCDSEYVALLNPDALPAQDWLEKLAAMAKAHPDAAAFGSRQMIHGAEGLLDGIGDTYHLSGLAWRSRHGLSLTPADLVPREIFSPCAAAALYRRDVLVEAGGFDEDFFCYVEDVDLGFRLRLLGYSAWYVPEAVVHHVGSATSGGRHSDFTVYHGHRNLVWCFLKNMPGGLFWLLLPLHLLLNVFSLMAIALMRGQGAIMLKAKRDAVFGLPKMWRKRQDIQKQRKASVKDIWRMLDKRLSFSRT